VAPGQVLAYGRNEHTLRALDEGGGFRLVEATDFLSSDELPAAGERLAIAFEGSELVRGGGGPRCMTMPIRRDELE
jgi:arginine deiminase